MEVYCSQHGSKPNGLFEIYVQYKKDTQAIIKWLLSNSPTRCNDPRQLSVRDLVGIAESLCKRAVAMPEIINFHFRQAIAARTHMSKFFRRLEKGQKQDTADHEFFTESLTKMYVDLCACCSKPRLECNHKFLGGDHQSDPERCKNIFAALQLDGNDGHESDDRPHELPFQGTGDAASNVDGSETPETSVKDDVVLADDTLSTMLERMSHVQTLENLTLFVNQVWAQAGREQGYLLAAVAITNAAYAHLETIEWQLIHNCAICSPEELYERIVNQENDLDLKPTAPDSEPTSVVSFISRMNDSWQSMQDFQTFVHQPDGYAGLMNAQPSEISLKQGGQTADSDDHCRRLLLLNMSRCIHSLRNTFVRNGSPVYAEVGYFVSRDRKPDNCMHCTSGLSLLLSSYKAHSFALTPGQLPSACRIQTLRLAQEAVSSIKAVLEDSTMPCRCLNTLAYHLEGLLTDFESFLKTKMFDFYFQSPWVCGGQMLEMLHALNYYGLRLLAYKSFVGSVVHIYHVLRRMDEIAKLPVLDALCTHLEDLFFPGGRPEKYFKNSYLRCLGGRLRFHGKKTHETGCHTLMIPAHIAKATAGLSSAHHGDKDSRFDCGRFSTLLRLKERGFSLHGSDLDVLRSDHASPTEPCRSRAYEAQDRNKDDYCHHSDPTARLAILHQAVEAELSHPFPIVRINLLRIYLLCSRIIDRLSDEYHGTGSKPGQYCLCCAEDLIAAADGCRAGKGWKSRRAVRELVDMTVKILKEEMGGLKTRDVTWRDS